MAVSLMLAKEGNYVLARRSNRQQSMGRCCGGHNWVWSWGMNWLHCWSWRRERNWVLVSHHWDRRGKIGWLLSRDRNIKDMMVVSQANRDSLSSGREVSSSRTGNRERYWEMLTSLDRDHGVEW